MWLVFQFIVRLCICGARPRSSELPDQALSDGEVDEVLRLTRQAPAGKRSPAEEAPEEDARTDCAKSDCPSTTESTTCSPGRAMPSELSDPDPTSSPVTGRLSRRPSKLMDADTAIAIRMKDGTFREAVYHPDHEIGRERSEEDRSKYPARYSTAVAKGFSIEGVELVDVSNIWVLEGPPGKSATALASPRSDISAGEVAKLISSGAQAVSGKGEQDMQRVAFELSQCSELVYLNLSGVKDLGQEASGDDWCCTLSKAILANQQVLHLNLSHTQIGLPACAALSEMLLQNSTLVSLDISFNPIGDEGCVRGKLAEMLTKNFSLQVLRMNGCQVGDEGAIEFASALVQNVALLQLGLAANNISDAGGFQLAYSIPKSGLVGLDLEASAMSGPKWFEGQKVRVSHDPSLSKWYNATVAAIHGEKVFAKVFKADGTQGWPHTWEYMEPEEGSLSVMQTIQTSLQAKRSADGPVCGG